MDGRTDGPTEGSTRGPQKIIPEIRTEKGTAWKELIPKLREREGIEIQEERNTEVSGFIYDLTITHPSWCLSYTFGFAIYIYIFIALLNLCCNLSWFTHSRLKRVGRLRLRLLMVEALALISDTILLFASYPPDVFAFQTSNLLCKKKVKVKFAE